MLTFELLVTDCEFQVTAKIKILIRGHTFDHRYHPPARLTAMLPSPAGKYPCIFVVHDSDLIKLLDTIPFRFKPLHKVRRYDNGYLVIFRNHETFMYSLLAMEASKIFCQHWWTEGF